MTANGPSAGRAAGFGALSNAAGRFATRQCIRANVEHQDAKEPERIEVQLMPDSARTVIARNRSPDLPFSQSINPYRGCEHGCIYCYARATHSYLDLSPGIDFETRLFFKPGAAERLRAEITRSGYRPSPIALGTNTDPYQPVERELGITRSILQVLLEHRHPVTIVTKSALIRRDMKILSDLARHDLVSVCVSVTTLDDELKRRMEPRTASGRRRVEIIGELHSAGVPVGVLAAPIIPALNDHEIETMLQRSAEAGARHAGYVLLRLPHEVADLFNEWLHTHFPRRAAHVLSLLRQMRGGRLNDPHWHSRQRGRGAYADLIAQRFARACRRWGLDHGQGPQLRTDLVRTPGPITAGSAFQLALFPD